MITYTYHITGTASQGQTWATNGQVTAEPGDFTEVVQAALIGSFEDLTSGKAVYGRPGIGCDGPYRILELIIREKQEPKR